MKTTFTIVLFFMVCGLRAQWQQTNGPVGGYTDRILKVSHFLFVNGQAGGIFRSADYGLTWTAVNNGLPSSPHCYFLTRYENKLYASIASNGIYFSSDFGESWTPINNGIATTTSYSLLVNGQDIYAGADYGGYYYSSDHGDTWTFHSSEFSGMQIRNFVLQDNKLFAAAGGGENTGVYMSEDKGVVWTKLGLAVTSINAMEGVDSILYVSGGQPLEISRDYGATWHLDPTGAGIGYYMNAISAKGEEVYIGASNGAIFHSRDAGRNWVITYSAPDNTHNSILFDGDTVLLGTTEGVYFSADTAKTWTPRNEGIRNHIVEFLKTYKGTLAAATTTDFFISVDNGRTWSIDTVGVREFGYNTVGGIYYRNDYAVGGTTEGIFKRSTSAGPWVQKVALGPNESITTLEGEGNAIIAGVSGGAGLYVSLDSGEHWTLRTDPLFENTAVYCSALKGDTIVIGADNNILISKDMGESWSESKLSSSFFHPNRVIFHHSHLIISTYQGIFQTSDLGGHWTNLGDLPAAVHPEDMLLRNDSTFYLASAHGVYVTYNEGANWYLINDGFEKNMTSLAFLGDTLFCGTYGMSVWRVPLKDLNADPLIKDQKENLSITSDETITLSLSDFTAIDPEGEPLTLAVYEGSNYTVEGDVITPDSGFAGDLSIPVTVNDGERESATFIATVKVSNVVGTDETFERPHIYPNPASGKISVVYHSPQPFTVDVIDLFGRIILEQNSRRGTRDLLVDLSSVTTGLYVIKIRSGKESQTARLIIK